MTVSGADYNKSYITQDELINAGEIVFTMGIEPNKAFGTGSDALPTSLTKEGELPQAYNDVIKVDALVNKNTEDTKPLE